MDSPLAMLISAALQPSRSWWYSTHWAHNLTPHSTHPKTKNELLTVAVQNDDFIKKIFLPLQRRLKAHPLKQSWIMLSHIDIGPEISVQSTTGNYQCVWILKTSVTLTIWFQINKWSLKHPNWLNRKPIIITKIYEMFQIKFIFILPLPSDI